MFIEVISGEIITPFVETEGGLQQIEEDSSLYEEYLSAKSEGTGIKQVYAGNEIPRVVTVTIDDYLLDLDYRLSMMELGL